MNLDDAIECGIVDEYAIKFEHPNFDRAIIGVDYEGKLIYSYDKMVKQFSEDNNCSYEDSVDFIQYNT